MNKKHKTVLSLCRDIILIIFLLLLWLKNPIYQWYMTNNPPLQTEIEEAFRALAFEQIESKKENFVNTGEWFSNDSADLWGGERFCVVQFFSL